MRITVKIFTLFLFVVCVLHTETSIADLSKEEEARYKAYQQLDPEMKQCISFGFRHFDKLDINNPENFKKIKALPNQLNKNFLYNCKVAVGVILTLREKNAGGPFKCDIRHPGLVSHLHSSPLRTTCTHAIAPRGFNLEMIYFRTDEEIIRNLVLTGVVNANGIENFVLAEAPDQQGQKEFESQMNAARKTREELAAKIAEGQEKSKKDQEYKRSLRPKDNKSYSLIVCRGFHSDVTKFERVALEVFELWNTQQDSKARQIAERDNVCKAVFEEIDDFYLRQPGTSYVRGQRGGGNFKLVTRKIGPNMSMDHWFYARYR